MTEHSVKTSPKDFFLHLLAIVTLYVSAISFTTIIFQYANLLFPDPLEYQYYDPTSGIYSVIRWALASLIIIFPVYIWSSWYLDKGYSRHPEKRKLRIRRWLIYFTLFAAALIIIGDLIALVYNLLEGELTMRFIIKIFSVLFVAGSVFGYYFWDLKRHGEE